MSLISSMLCGFYGLRADVGGAPAPWDDFWYQGVGAPSVSGMRVTPDTAKRLSAVIACVSAKCRALGVLPCYLYTDVAGGGKQLAKTHPYFNLLHKRPNGLQTAFEFFEMLQGHVELRGNAYAEKLTSSRGIVGEMIPMHPDKVRVEMLSNGHLRYNYDDPNTKTTRRLLQDEVMHVREWPDQMQVGQSRISMAIDVFGVALGQQDYAGKYLKNDATAGLIITGTNFETKQEEKEYEAAFLASATGENRHKIKMLPPGVDIKSIGVKPSDFQLLDGIKASDVKICSIFNVLPHLVGIDAGKAATYASVEQFNLMHAQQCVLPMAVRWEQTLQRDVIDDDRFYAKFSLASLLRGDFATRMAGYAVAIEHGWLCQDDVRELEDLNPIAGGIGKKYWRALNWTTLDAMPAAPVSPQSDPPEEPADPDQDEGTGQESDSQTALRTQLQLFAHDSASRCVRREVNGVRKLIEREAGVAEIGAFYAEQQRFICEVFHFTAVQALKSKQACDTRLYALARILTEEDQAAATTWIEQVGLTEPMKLAALAVEGVV